jgi:hypothetical protein
MLKTKRVPDSAFANATLIRSPQLGGTGAQIRARDQLLDIATDAAGSGFATRFARAVRKVGEGVTIGIDKKLNVVITQNASTEVVNASGKGFMTGEPVLPADGLTDPRMRDLDETVSQFMRESKSRGVAGPARARFAAAVLGIVAKDGTKVEAVADAAIDGLLDQLNGKKGWSPALPKEVTTLLTAAAKAWRATSEADFWTDMAAAAQRADGASDDAFLREQAAWMGLVAKLSDADLPLPPKQGIVQPPAWRWNTAAEKADLVDTLVAAAAGADNAPRAVLRRLRTLTRGTDPLPRAIAAELAQLAFAALAGVKTAPALDRREVLTLKERAPDPNATLQEQAEHQTREALRSTAQALAARSGLSDPLQTALFRNKLSTLYAEMKEVLRLYESKDPTDEDDPPGEQRLQRLMDIVGTLDQAVVDGLDAWSATIASGSIDPADYLAKARVAKAALDGVLQRMEDAKDPSNDTRSLYRLGSPEATFVGSAVEMLSAELGLEAGEVLLGQLAPPNEPAAGLRHRLKEMRENKKLIEGLRRARAAGKQKTVPVAQKLAALKPKPPWADKLIAAATAFDTANNPKPPDPVLVAASAAALVAAGTEARRAGARLGTEAERQRVAQALDQLYLTAAEELRQVPPVPPNAVDPVGPEIDRLVESVTPVPLPAQGVGLDRFWSNQKAAALRALPNALRTQLDDAMSLDLRDELEKLDKVAARGDDAATEAQGWAVVRVLRAYKVAVRKLPDDRAETRARLLAALDGVATSVEKRLSPGPAPADA